MMFEASLIKRFLQGSKFLTGSTRISAPTLNAVAVNNSDSIASIGDPASHDPRTFTS